MIPPIAEEVNSEVAGIDNNPSKRDKDIKDQTTKIWSNNDVYGMLEKIIQNKKIILFVKFFKNYSFCLTCCEKEKRRRICLFIPLKRVNII